MQKLFAFLFAFMTVSPLWPLGPNPLPGDPFIIVNKRTNEIAFVDDGEIQAVYKAATGKAEDLTPEGMFTVTVKAVNPYYRKKNIRGGSPDNPLGSRWIGFNALNTDGRVYGIHGTNAPWSIGLYISQGCIRLNNKDVEELYDKVPLGTKVFITSEQKSFEQIAKEKRAIP